MVVVSFNKGWIWCGGGTKHIDVVDFLIGFICETLFTPMTMTIENL